MLVRLITPAQLVNVDVVYDAVRLISHPIDRGLGYLREHQNTDGGWGEYGSSTGITGLVTLAFLNHGVSEQDETDSDGDGTPDIQEAIRLLLENYEELDESHGRFGGDIRGVEAFTYDTSIAMLVLIAADHTNNPNIYADHIRKSMNYLLSIQLLNDPTDPDYGGWGYPSDNWADLSNTQWAVMALDAAYDYFDEEKPAWRTPDTWTNRVVEFADRIQDSVGDGGYDYKVDWWGFSAGSMTHAGIWTNLLAGRNRDHERVQDAMNWVQSPPDPHHWSVTENPGRGTKALYYYYATMSKSLAIMGKTMVNVNGTAIDWFQDMNTELTSGGHPQQNDGYWYNSDTSEWEGDENLVTAYAILALESRSLPPNMPISVSIILHSPADLHLYDMYGRHTGINYDSGEIEQFIPGTQYSALDPQTINVIYPEAGNYTLQLIGTDDDNFELEIIGEQDGIVVDTDTYTGAIRTHQVLGSLVYLSAIEGSLTILSTPPETMPDMQLLPGDLTFSGSYFHELRDQINIAEAQGEKDIYNINLISADLRDTYGNIIPGKEIFLEPKTFSLAAGSNKTVDVVIPLDQTIHPGKYYGYITIESNNAGAKKLYITVNVWPPPIFLPSVSAMQVVDTGFNSQFNSSSSGWTSHAGTWTVTSEYYGTDGLSEAFASTSYDKTYTDFDYRVKLMREGCEECANSIVVRGTPTPFGAGGRWHSGYSFNITRNGFYSVVKYTDGSGSLLQGWAYSSAINTGSDWNTLRAVADGSNLRFYINGALVWSGTNSSYVSGRVGIAMYRTADSSGDQFWADWATLDILNAVALQNFDQETISIDQENWNTAADHNTVEDDRKAP